MNELTALTDKRKAEIDAMSYEQMLRKWRFAPLGDPAFQGERGAYFSETMHAKKKFVDHVQASKNVGWE